MRGRRSARRDDTKHCIYDREIQRKYQFPTISAATTVSSTVRARQLELLSKRWDEYYRLANSQRNGFIKENGIESNRTDWLDCSPLPSTRASPIKLVRSKDCAACSARFVPQKGWEKQGITAHHQITAIPHPTYAFPLSFQTHFSEMGMDYASLEW